MNKMQIPEINSFLFFLTNGTGMTGYPHGQNEL
jgi:hypothetical protein